MPVNGQVLPAVAAIALTGGAAGIAVNAWQLSVAGVPAAEMDPAAANVAATAVPFVLLAAVVLTTGGTVGDHAVLATSAADCRVSSPGCARWMRAQGLGSRRPRASLPAAEDQEPGAREHEHHGAAHDPGHEVVAGARQRGRSGEEGRRHAPSLPHARPEPGAPPPRPSRRRR